MSGTHGRRTLAGFRQSPTRVVKAPSPPRRAKRGAPSALRSPLSPRERDRNQNHSPLRGGEGGPQGGGVRGLFVGNISIALKVCYARDFDGALGLWQISSLWQRTIQGSHHPNPGQRLASGPSKWGCSYFSGPS